MSEAIYILCALTSIGCAVLLLRAFARTGSRLLLWSGICFGWLAVNNVLLFLDLAVIESIDFGLWRSGTALVGVLFLLYGLVTEST